MRCHGMQCTDAWRAAKLTSARASHCARGSSRPAQRIAPHRSASRRRPSLRSAPLLRLRHHARLRASPVGAAGRPSRLRACRSGGWRASERNAEQGRAERAAAATGRLHAAAALHQSPPGLHVRAECGAHSFSFRIHAHCTHLQASVAISKTAELAPTARFVHHTAKQQRVAIGWLRGGSSASR